MVQALRVKSKEKYSKAKVRPLIHPAGMDINRTGQWQQLRRYDDGKVLLHWPDNTVELFVPAKAEEWESVKAPVIDIVESIQ